MSLVVRGCPHLNHIAFEVPITWGTNSSYFMGQHLGNTLPVGFKVALAVYRAIIIQGGAPGKPPDTRVQRLTWTQVYKNQEFTIQQSTWTNILVKLTATPNSNA